MAEMEKKYRILMNSWLFIICFLISCQQTKIQEKKGNKSDIINDFIPELRVNQFELRNPNTLINLGSQSVLLQENLRYSPVLALADQDRTQYLLAYHYEGDLKNYFSCFEIGYISDESNLREKVNKIETREFKTESGLKLGMTVDQITSSKGKNYTVQKKNNLTIIKYSIENANSPILRKYNMPSYFMEFYLQDNRVNKLLFGFGYP